MPDIVSSIIPERLSATEGATERKMKLKEKH